MTFSVFFTGTVQSLAEVKENTANLRTYASEGRDCHLSVSAKDMLLLTPSQWGCWSAVQPLRAVVCRSYRS